MKISLLGAVLATILLNILVAHAESPSPAEVHTRSLAASCAACHGTNGNGVAGALRLAGLKSSYFTSQMQAFKSGARKATVMHRHAKGLTDEEIVQLAEYFANQLPIQASSLRSQTLSKTHD